jgi:hypothetical protein
MGTDYWSLTSVRDTIVLAIMNIATGVLAGLLVVTFDFAPHRTILFILLAVLTTLNVFFMYIAYAR